MSLPRVLVTDFLVSEPDLEAEELSGLAEVEACAASDESELADRLPGAAALIVWHVIRIGAASLDRLGGRIIVRAGVGYDNIDLAAAAERGVIVCHVPDYGTEDVADHAVAMGLALLRRLPEATATIRAGGWSWQLLRPLRRLRGLRVGIVGLGRIGTATALRWRAFGCAVSFVDPYLPDGADKALGIGRHETLAELLAVSDVVTLHCPLTDETRHLIDADALARMREDAVLINTARGGVVETTALAATLAAGRLRGAALDVLPEEPGTDADPLYAGYRRGEPWANRVLLTPHTAFYTEEGLTELRRKSARTVRALLEGRPVRNRVG